MSKHRDDPGSIPSASNLSNQAYVYDGGSRKVDDGLLRNALRGTNWAGNVTYSAVAIRRPRTVDDVRAAIVGCERARALGAGHSFSKVGDTEGVLISTEHLTHVHGPDANGRVSVGAGTSYGALARWLHKYGRALPNFASLPHISIGGAIATATHGSGVVQPSLASCVCEIELLTSDGAIRQLQRGEPDFDGAVVSLGALGIVTALTLETVPAFLVRQYVFEHLPWERVETSLADVLACGYSTSLFVSWATGVAEQVWVKSLEPVESLYEARPAERQRHPIAGNDPQLCTAQLGVPGNSFDRLPHFRPEGLRSAGDERQSEYIVRADVAIEALRELRRIGPAVAPALYASEIRAVAADGYWLSPFYERDSVAIHLTWRREHSAIAGISRVEAALARFHPRPHWGKLFFYDAKMVAAVYPRLADFIDLRSRLDPLGIFRNAFIDRLAGAV